MKKKISNLDVYAISLGCIIGFGAFMLPGSLFIPLGIKETIVAFLCMIFLLIPIVLSYHVLVKKYPNNSGGEFFYILKELGRAHGFFSGMFLAFSYITIISLNILNLYFVINLLFSFIPVIYRLGMLVIILSALLLTNLIHMCTAVKVSTILGVYLFLSVVSILLLFVFNKNIPKDLLISQTSLPFQFTNFLKIISIAPFAFIGFDTVVQLSEKIKNINKYTTVTSVVSGALIYISLSIITSISFDANSVSNVTWALGESVKSHLGIGFFYIILSAFLIAIVMGVNGFLLATTELFMSFAQNDLAPKTFAKANKSGTYGVSLLAIFAIALIFTQFGRDNVIILVDAASMGITLIYFYMSYITFKSDKFLGFISMLSSLVFVFLLTLPIFYKKIPALNNLSYYLFLGWIALGIIIYNLFIRSKKDKR